MLDMTAKELSTMWAHPALLEIWITLQFPDFENGEAVLKGEGLQRIVTSVLTLNKEFNHPEIKALRYRLNGASHE